MKLYEFILNENISWHPQDQQIDYRSEQLEHYKNIKNLIKEKEYALLISIQDNIQHLHQNIKYTIIDNDNDLNYYINPFKNLLFNLNYHNLNNIMLKFYTTIYTHQNIFEIKNKINDLIQEVYKLNFDIYLLTIKSNIKKFFESISQILSEHNWSIFYH